MGTNNADDAAGLSLSRSPAPLSVEAAAPSDQIKYASASTPLGVSVPTH